MATPPKTTQDIAAAGGRHYKGRGLGTLQAWKCPACGIEQGGRFEAGCISCGAGKPGRVLPKQPGGPAVVTPPARPPAPRSALSEQLATRKGAAVDYDEIERRMVRALEGRLGGGYTDQERATLYNALECYIALWDEGTIEPATGLTLDATRQLAQKVAPDTGLDYERTETDGNTDTTAPANAAPEGLGEYADDEHPDDRRNGSERASDATADYQRGPTTARSSSAGPAHPAPQLVDPDPGPDEGGEDDANRDGE